jgi:PAS domain S-box-containing protein
MCHGAINSSHYQSPLRLVTKVPSLRNASKRITVVFTIALLTLVGSGVLTCWSISRYLDAVRWVGHTREVLDELAKVRSNVAFVEAGSRGFIVTENTAFILALEQHESSARKSLDRIQNLTSGSRTQVDRIAQLRPLLERRIEAAKRYVDLHAKGEIESARNLVRDSAEELKGRESDRLLTAMQGEEAKLLADRSETATNQGRATIVIVIISSLIAAAVVFIAGRLVRRDLFRRYLAEEEQERFFNISLDMLCISNADGHFKRLSPAFQDTLGWSIEELKRRPFLDFVHPEDREATLAEVDRQVTRGEPVLQFENRYLHKDGTYRIFSWKSMPGPDNSMYATARDVTAQKQVEERVAKLNSDLMQRAQELEIARNEADRANAAKSEFLSHMSHELRTPLNAVIGFGQLLQMQSDDEKVHSSASSILKAGRHLLDLVNEILDLARIEAGKLTLSVEAVPVTSALVQVIELERPLAEERGIDLAPFEGCDDLHVSADRQRLVQILLNLLSNAVKYNRPNGRVDISCKAGDVSCRITVKDTGPGFDAEAQQRLFVPFERGNQREQGTGLGLTLSRHLARMMKGELSLIQTSSEGSTFALDLPIAQAPELPESTESLRPPAELYSGKLKLVYIEDNLSNLQLMEQVMAQVGGYELIPAMQASIGLQLIENNSPDAVLLDVHLPDGNGLDVLKRLKSDPKLANIPVVVLSADATDAQIRRLIQAGATAYLTKPIDLNALFEELNKITPRKL